MTKSNGTYITLKEASILIGKSCSTVYRLGQLNLIPWKREMVEGNEMIMFDRPALMEFFDGKGKEQSLTKSEVKEVIEQYFEARETQKMKPLEQQAFYRVGRLESENSFLKEKLETVIGENTELREKYKALEGPAEKLKEVEEENKKLKEDLKLLPASPGEVSRILLENASNMRILQTTNTREREKLAKEKDSLRDSLLRQEEYIDFQEKKITELEEKLQREEEEKCRIAEAWKEKVEELERPWWAKIFGYKKKKG